MNGEEFFRSTSNMFSGVSNTFSGKEQKVFDFLRNQCSIFSGISVRSSTELVFELGRNLHYGSPRIALDLGKRGIKCSRPRVARLMREMGIRARCARKFKVTTDSNHKEPIAPNFLDQDFYPDMPFEVWTSDLTYLWTDSGWQYLTVVMELFNREIIGYSLSRSMSTETTVIPAFEMAVLHRQPPEGVLFHSDRGVQYASVLFG
ncbi:DDE-type integrase/transposase/recombinase [Chlorobium phaeovibrioides]|uniref:DDE-type integrase/transposase/recombinase n=1 Tax=Chlorobium phaeovibrioides TaxID=1094 RepID=A0A5M8I8A9_CHLPH|nr:DDE-type integrase/transposase/recombinase [Chlorobium phaeovibrioides]KAA6231738.1 DDE-type integrase/transposase/recombinase [Chlorobium phaeovibrioides]